jgi:hypothetical protein
LPFRFTPERTSSVVEVAPNAFATVFAMIYSFDFAPLEATCLHNH